MDVYTEGRRSDDDYSACRAHVAELLSGDRAVRSAQDYRTVMMKTGTCIRAHSRRRLDIVSLTITYRNKAFVDNNFAPAAATWRSITGPLESSVRFRCLFSKNKAGFYRSFNAIFGKIGRCATEEVVFALIKTKCLPVLLYGTEVCPTNAADLLSLIHI